MEAEPFLPELCAIIQGLAREFGLAQRASMRRVCRAWRDLDPDIRWQRNHPDLLSVCHDCRYLLRYLIKELERLEREANIAVPAPTSINWAGTLLWDQESLRCEVDDDGLPSFYLDPWLTRTSVKTIAPFLSWYPGKILRIHYENRPPLHKLLAAIKEVRAIHTVKAFGLPSLALGPELFTWFQSEAWTIVKAFGDINIFLDADGNVLPI